MKTERLVWGALWRSDNKLDGKRQHLINDLCLPVLFRTRREAREWIETRYGYIRKRDDLRMEPHGWQMPIAIRVKVLL